MKRSVLSIPKSLLCGAMFLLFVTAPMARGAPFAYVVTNHCASSSCSANTISVIDTATDATLGSPIPVGYKPVGAAVSPDGSRVYVTNTCPYNSECGRNGTVSVIDATVDKVLTTIPVGSSPEGVSVSPDGTRVYVANNFDGTVSVINAATNATLGNPIRVGQNPVGVTVSPDGRKVYVTNSCTANCTNGTVSVIDTATNQVVATVPVGFVPKGIAVSHNGGRVYVANACGSSSSCGSNGTVSVINTATNILMASVSVGFAPDGIAVNPDGSRVYVANACGSSSSCGSNGTISVINTATEKQVATVSVGAEPKGIAVSPDGSRVYVVNSCGSSPSCGSNATISVIDTATNSVIGSPIPVDSPPFDVLGANNGPNLGEFVGPGALIASNSDASGGTGTQISGTVPTLGNTSGCGTTDEVVRTTAEGSVTLDASTGSFSYTPTSSTYSGPDAFTWHGKAPGCTAAAAPSTAVSNTATVSFTLDPQLTGLGTLMLAEGDKAQETFSLTGSTPFKHTLANDDATVIPPAGVTISPAACGTAGNLVCTLSITAASTPGTAGLTINVADKYGDTVTKHIDITVKASSSSQGSSGNGTSGGGISTPLGLLALAVLLGLSSLRRFAAKLIVGCYKEDT